MIAVIITKFSTLIANYVGKSHAIKFFKNGRQTSFLAFQELLFTALQ